MTRHDMETVRRAMTTLETSGRAQVSWTSDDGNVYELRLVAKAVERPAEKSREVPGLSRAQNYVRGLAVESRSVVDELIAERREEARKEP